MSRAGAVLQAMLDKLVHQASFADVEQSESNLSKTAVRDLESIQKFMTSPAYLALFDIFWTPIFLVGISIFHPWLGYLAVSGGAVLIAVAILGQYFTKNKLNRATVSAIFANQWSDLVRGEASTFKSLGMSDAVFGRTNKLRTKALDENLTASDVSSVFSTFTKTIRLLLQSLMLGLGALLVLKGELTPGAMIAGSILLGRALAPIELLVGQWSPYLRARQSKSNLKKLLKGDHAYRALMELPKPEPAITVQSLSYEVSEKGEPILENLNFSLSAGDVLGVIGPSGAGKSTLAKIICGAISPTDGEIRLGDAKLEFYSAQKLGEYIGYVPQSVRLYEGTIGENIAKLSEDPDPERVVKAAEAAAAANVILGLEKGYDTFIDGQSNKLSGGQVQRIGLARGLYDDPLVLVLDEPNSNLDNDGTTALNIAVKSHREANNVVVIMAHRPSAIQECNKLLVLDKGKQLSYGDKDTVLKKMVKNYQQIKAAQ